MRSNFLQRKVLPEEQDYGKDIIVSYLIKTSLVFSLALNSSALNPLTAIGNRAINPRGNFLGLEGNFLGMDKGKLKNDNWKSLAARKSAKTDRRNSNFESNEDENLDAGKKNLDENDDEVGLWPDEVMTFYLFNFLFNLCFQH